MFNFGKKTKKQPEERSGVLESLMYNSASGYSTNKSLLLSAVYRCVEVISDSVA